jgi:hypothetical protein
MSNPEIITRCIDGAALAPLSREQKKDLILLAQRAFERVSKNSALPAPYSTFDAWRHQQVMQVCERGGLREARNEDFLALQGHFLGLLGQPVLAERRRVASQLEPRRWALAKLHQECDAATDVIDRPWDYICSIARSRFKTPQIEELGEKQIWMLMFDVRRNAQRRRAKGKAA